MYSIGLAVQLIYVICRGSPSSFKYRESQFKSFMFILNNICYARKIESVWYNLCLCQLECIQTTTINTQTFSGKSRNCWEQMPRSGLTSFQVHGVSSILIMHLKQWTSEDLWVQVFFPLFFCFTSRNFKLALRWVLFCSNRWFALFRRPEFTAETYFPCTPLFLDWLVRIRRLAPRKTR